ncbi:MAG: type I methionyl aminopeptidase [Gemmatimonadales bacterium]
MSVESDQDLQGLREAGRVVREVLTAMTRQVRPGVRTADLDAVAARVLAANGARHAPRYAYGFPGDSCISVNDEAVHGIPGSRALRSGDLVKLDVVVEKNGYLVDAAETVTVGPANDLHRQLISCTRSAFRRAMEVARAGNRVSEIGRAIDTEVRRHGFAVLRDLSGHGTGRKIHEEPSVPNYYDRRARQRLTEGLVIAVEPIVSARQTETVDDPDGWTIRTADGSLAAHYEQTIVITRGHPTLLTAA